MPCEPGVMLGLLGDTVANQSQHPPLGIHLHALMNIAGQRPEEGESGKVREGFLEKVA